MTASTVTPAVPECLTGVPGGHEGRHDAEEEAAQERDCHRDGGDRKIQAQLVDPRDRNAVADERQQSAMAQHGNNERGQPACDGQHKALGQQLSDQPRAPCAERRAHPEFAFAGGASRQQEACNVDARDQQDWSNDTPSRNRAKADELPRPL